MFKTIFGKNINFGFANKSMMKNPILINEPINNITYQDEIISFSFILNDKNKIKFDNLKEPIQVEMWAKDPLNEIRESIMLKLDDNIIKLKNGNNLLKTIIGLGLKFNKQIIDSTEKEVEFAKKYQILSKNTALFGEIKREDESQKSELIKVDINKEREKRRNSYSKIVNKKGHGFRPMMRMTKGRVMTAIPSGLRPSNTGATKGISIHGTLRVNKAFATKGISKSLASKVMNIVKKASYEQKSDGTISIVDAFNDMLMAQDIIEGFWDENKETKNIISKVKKGGFEKIVQYIKAKNITDNFNRIVYTILAIYYIEKTKANSIKEYRLVLNKGKKYLLSKGINYDEEIKKINI
jgi:hypothetical protein